MALQILKSDQLSILWKKVIIENLVGDRFDPTPMGNGGLTLEQQVGRCKCYTPSFFLKSQMLVEVVETFHCASAHS